ncbi:MAG: glycosyltransferase [Cyanobacteria bacterium J06638_7]
MKTAIATLAAGPKIKPIADLSLPLMIKYADRTGSDFVSLSPVYSNRFLGIPNYEKLQILDLLEYYDRVAFIDADTLISPRAPSLFEIVNHDHLGVFIASRYSDGHNPSIKAILGELGEIQWRRESRNPEIYQSFNSGVIVLNREIGRVFAREVHLAEKWARFDLRGYFMSDQPFLNYLSQKHSVPMQDIGFRYNHTLAPGVSSLRFCSYIIHYAGISHREANWFRRPSKAAKMSHDYWILRSHVLSRLAKDHPPLVAFLDCLL